MKNPLRAFTFITALGLCGAMCVITAQEAPKDQDAKNASDEDSLSVKLGFTYNPRTNESSGTVGVVYNDGPLSVSANAGYTHGSTGDYYTGSFDTNYNSGSLSIGVSASYSANNSTISATLGYRY